jgi:DNA-binding response OmpR family regulator
VVEDERLTRESLALFLKGEGYHVREAAGVSACRAALRASPADLVLLDLGLPGEDAIGFARELREARGAAVLVITKDARLDTRLLALEEGVDDYLQKPVNFRELAARIRNIARRAGLGSTGVYQLGPWRVDLGRRVVEDAGGAEARLTRGEFDILAALTTAGGRVVSRERLSAALSGDATGDPRSVDALVSRIRRKLDHDGDELILTAPGLGYRLAVIEPGTE